MQVGRLTVGSLFAGIGGMDLGLERAGFQVRWQVEIDDYATRVLEKHWPNVARYRDVRDVGKHNLEPVDLIAGGFPCQDVSLAARGRAGITGQRSGLWAEYRRIICELRPQYALMENVPGLLSDGMGTVLSDLAEVGYDAEWQVLPAAAFGAPHIRERIFILAYPNGIRSEAILQRGRGGKALERPELYKSSRSPRKMRSGVWADSESTVLGMANGVPLGLDKVRIRTIGNAVVPQVAEWIGRRIMEAAQ